MTVLYTKPGCVQCNATARKFDSTGIDYTAVDLTEDPNALAEMKKLGYLQAPVIYVDADTHWSGHRPDLIEKHLL